MERDVAEEIAAAIEIRRGHAPIVVYAPHGGRRTRAVIRGDSVNDLHTAEIALEIAESLGASALVNPRIDRNGADLNRVSVLAAAGREVLAALRSLVEHAASGSRDDIAHDAVTHGVRTHVVSTHGVSMPGVGAHGVDSYAGRAHALDSSAGGLRPRDPRGCDASGERTPTAASYAADSSPIVPLVLLVHGWNVTLPACDIGIGLSARAGRLSGAHPTVSRATFDGFVTRLASSLTVRGIEAPIGRRYPGAGRDNGTQLFSGRHASHENADVAALSALARLGGVDAVQLELAIPLRWPGAYRRAFVDAIVEAASEECARRQGARTCVPREEWRAVPSGSSSSAARAVQLDATAASSAATPAESRASAEPLPSGWSLQAVLADGGGLFAGAEPTGEGEAAARLCVVRPDGRMLLFVGEGEWEGDERVHRIGGFELRAGSPGGNVACASAVSPVEVGYRGPMVVYPSHDAFCDLELGLAGAVLIDADTELSFEPSAEHGNGFGRLSGRIRTREETVEIDCLAVCERGSRRGGSGRALERVFVTSGPWAPAAAIVGMGAACDWRQTAAGEIDEIRLRLADGREGVARVLTRVPVYRVIGRDVVVKVTFGTAVLDAIADESGSETSLALFERIEILGRT